MARAGKTLNQTLKDWNRMFSPKGQEEIQQHIRKIQGNTILAPLKQRLFNFGVSGDGTKLAPYNPKTILLKRAKGVRTTPTTLF